MHTRRAAIRMRKPCSRQVVPNNYEENDDFFIQQATPATAGEDAGDSDEFEDAVNAEFNQGI